MKDFKLVTAKTVDEAVEALAKYGDQCKLIAGGTDAMLMIRDGKWNNLTLINIRDIEELRGIKLEGDTVTIGALTRLSDIEHSDVLKEHAPCLWGAAQLFADPTNRHSATIGGNVGRCNTVGDTLPSLLCLDAVVTIVSKEGEREVPMSEMLLGPGKTACEPNEMIAKFTFKSQPHSAYMKFGRRKSMALSMAGSAVSIKVDDNGIVEDIRIAAGNAGPKAVRCYKAEKAMIGVDLKSDKAIEEPLYKVIQDDIAPRKKPRLGNWISGEYRRELISVLTKRAARKAAFGECMLCKQEEA